MSLRDKLDLDLLSSQSRSKGIFDINFQQRLPPIINEKLKFSALSVSLVLRYSVPSALSARLSQFVVYGGRVFVYTIYIYEVLDSIPLWDIVTQRERLWQRVSLSVIECHSCHRNSLWRGVMGEWLWWMQGQFNCLSSNVLNRKLIIWSLTSEKVDAAILDCKRQELLTKLNTLWFHKFKKEKTIVYQNLLVCTGFFPLM